MKTNKDGRAFDMTVELNAPRDLVWQAISSDRELERWFPVSAKVEPGVGGSVEWIWNGHYHWRHRIEVWEPGVRLQTSYPLKGEENGPPLYVDFFLEGDAGTTTLRLVHSGFGDGADFDDEYDGISGGWPVELGSLKLYLERHAGKDRKLARCIRKVENLDRDQIWQRLSKSFGIDPSMLEAPAGSRLVLETSTGDHFEGQLINARHDQLCCRVRNWNDAMFRVTVFDRSVWIWFAAYEQADGDIAALQDRFDRLLDDAFPASRAAAEAS